MLVNSSISFFACCFCPFFLTSWLSWQTRSALLFELLFPFASSRMKRLPRGTRRVDDVFLLHRPIYHSSDRRLKTRETGRQCNEVLVLLMQLSQNPHKVVARMKSSAPYFNKASIDIGFHKIRAQLIQARRSLLLNLALPALVNLVPPIQSKEMSIDRIEF